MLLNKANYGANWRMRPDGLDKVTGRLAYLTDMQLPGMLFGKVLRSDYPYARLVSVDTHRARQLPGVHAVITHLDVPGLNRFGILKPDQPVFCEDLVRFMGDAVAAVAAESEELADHALSLIKVTYEPLPTIDSPDAALRPDAPLLHPEGNVLHRTSYRHGNAAEAFAGCAFVTENSYHTPRQMHTYMETEGGLFVPENNAKLTVYSPTQHGYKDRMQLSRILAIPEADIRIVSSPIGGSFGGKEELTIQPYGALLALAANRPVKVHQSRFESVRSGIKRHPMSIKMRTGMDENGILIAHEATIVADTGAYATLGAPILNYASEHAQGAYRIPHVSIEGISVYTNNGVSGALRGFGVNQVDFAIEGQLDRLADIAGIDPWELRRRNIRNSDSLGPRGQRVAKEDGAYRVWQSVAESALMQNRTIANKAHDPWLRHGVGAAIAILGSNKSYGAPDPAGGRLRLNRAGKIEASFGSEEFGQGLLASLQIMLLERLGCSEEDVELVIGDTDRCPDTGSSTASRSTSLIWLALQRITAPFLQAMIRTASELTDIPVEAMIAGPGGIWLKTGGHVPVVTYRELAERSTTLIDCETQFEFPTTPDKIAGSHFLHAYMAVAVEVEVNLLTGRVKVTNQFNAVAAGPVINPMGYVGQIEGGSSMSLGFALMENAAMLEGRYLSSNLDTYLIPTIADTPSRFHVDAIESLMEGDEYGPRGVGEIGTVGVAPAIAAAIHHAVGKWVNELPVNPEEMIGDAAFELGRFS
jgi:xanthine dehydrogenase D subunit